MNIVHIIPGSGGSFYCGNCLRDSEIFQAIRKNGHTALKVPMYLPLFAHETSEGDMSPVFYGAISLYLKQSFPFMQKAPHWVDYLLNTKPMLRIAAGQAGSTRATGLEEMTISMLMGEKGQQNKELEEMVSWLENHFRPDVVHISNALLLGLVRKIKERLNVPVICSLQDEDVWVDVMEKEASAKVWALMRERAADVNHFIAVSNYFKSFMQEKLALPDHRIHSLYLGVDPDDYHYVNASNRKRNIGFLSRLTPGNGLDILVDAFILLKQHEGTEDVGLLLTGGQTSDDKPYIREQKEKLQKAGLEHQVQFVRNFEHARRKEFLEDIMLLSVPVRKGEAFGIYLIEAMAGGIPVVQPPLGAFPEILEKSGGGIISTENSPKALADSMLNLILQPGKVEQFSRQARNGVEKNFNIHHKAEKLIAIYQDAVRQFRPSVQQPGRPL